MKKLFQIYALILLLTLLTSMVFVVVPWENLDKKDPMVMMTFMLNGVLWGAALFYELTKKAYSLFIIHWLFCLLFFFCIAFTQYMWGVFPWVSYRADNLVLQTNGVLLVWTVFVWGVYKYTFQHTKIPSFSCKRLVHVPVWLIVSLSVVTFSNMIYRVITIGFDNLFSRATASLVYSVNSSAISLLMGQVLQALAFFAVILPLIRYKQTRKGGLFVLINLGCLLVSYFPTALSRYAVGVIYGSLLLIMFDSLRKNRMFVLFLLIGFLVILPFLNVFRDMAFAEVDFTGALQRLFSNLSTIWLAGDYDAYTMLTLTLEHVSNYGITWGKQLAGVLLFWVPRAWWMAKPIGSGSFITTQLGWQFTNLSAPLPAEGLINFGKGYLLFAGMVGYVMAKIDKYYWWGISEDKKQWRRLDVLYPILVLFFFFMNRGDLLSSVAYLMAYVAVGWLLLLFCTEKIRLHNNES